MIDITIDIAVPTVLTTHSCADCACYILLMTIKLLSTNSIMDCRAAHCPYYSYSHIMYGKLMDTVHRILSVCSLPSRADGMVRVLMRPYYGWWKYDCMLKYNITSSSTKRCTIVIGGANARIQEGYWEDDTVSVSKSSPVRFFDIFLDRPDLRPVA
jgi:hypothetical protein